MFKGFWDALTLGEQEEEIQLPTSPLQTTNPDNVSIEDLKKEKTLIGPQMPTKELKRLRCLSIEALHAVSEVRSATDEVRTPAFSTLTYLSFLFRTPAFSTLTYLSFLFTFVQNSELNTEIFLPAGDYTLSTVATFTSSAGQNITINGSGRGTT